MANNTIKRVWNANKLVSIEDLSGMTFQGENGGHTFEISGVDDSGSAVSISGTVTAVFLRADNAAISISGSVSSGKAVATLTQNCYTVPGRFLFTIFVTANSQKTAIYSATGNVARTEGTATGSVPPLVTDSIQTGSITASGDVTVGGVVDVVPRRCYGDMTSGGHWYNVMAFSAEDANQASGYIGAIINFYITRNGYGEAHNIQLNLVTGEICFTNEKSVSSALNIDKIRYRYNGSDGYVDIHNTVGATSVAVSFDVLARYNALNEFSAVALTQVADAPVHNGVSDTIAATYTFSANTNATGAFTGASGVTISENDIKRSGNVVYVHFYAQKSWSANTEYTVGSLSGVPLPSKNIRWLAGGGSAAYNATTPVYAVLDTAGTLKIYPSAAIGAVNITVSYIV